MSSLELQQARVAHQAVAPEPEQKKPYMNGDSNTVSKPPSKPQKGIMGMFSSKAAPKVQESSREIKPEQEEASQVPICAIRYSFKGRFRRKVSLIKFFKSMFQVELGQHKAAGKTNSMANFFSVQTSSE